MLDWSGMASGNFVMRRDLRELGLPSCHRAGGLRNRQNGLTKISVKFYRKISTLRPHLDRFVQAMRSQNSCPFDLCPRIRSRRIRVSHGSSF
jgi:hypothetical protein